MIVRAVDLIEQKATKETEASPRGFVNLASWCSNHLDQKPAKAAASPPWASFVAFCSLFAGVIAAVSSASGATPVPKAYRDFALRRDGDAARGRAIFFSTEKAACAQCHSLDGSNSKAGPDLFAIGDKFPRRELIDAILEPNAAIAVGYEATLIETTRGESFYGVIKQANDAAVELMGADGKIVRVPARDIKTRRPSPLSLMPEGVHSALTVQEFADLLEFLTTLRQPANALTSTRGMPDEIPELTPPVTLRPFLSEDMRFPSSVVRKPGDVRLGLVWFGEIPGRPNTFLGIHQSGRISVIEKNPAGDTKAIFADFSGEIYSQTGPNGLLGLAFHPKFRENRKYYLKHQVFEEGRIATVLVEKVATPDLRHDSGTLSRRLLTIPCVTQNHTGGCIEFGPDGFLYLGMGDTGPQQDPNGHGQDLRRLLGKMLRIDVDRRDAALPYAIPRDNPFRDREDARPEIWALGFREPWRFSFDRLTGDLWVGDVGQDRVEEVTIVRRGENHGWNVYEGFEPFSNQRRNPAAEYVAPVFAYKRKLGNSITGGYVYRGDPKSSFYGAYICGDYTSRRIWALTQENRTLRTVREIALAPESLASFGTDERGNIYVVGYEGMVYELDLAPAKFPAVKETSAGKTSDVGRGRLTPPKASQTRDAAGSGDPALHVKRTPTFERHAFPLPESIWSVEALDANGDGRTDLIAVGVTKVFALTAPDWLPHVLFDMQEGKMLYCVALDADGDGAVDLALGRYLIPWIDYRQARAQGKSPPEPKGPDFSVAWLRNTRRVDQPWPLQVIDRELNGIHGLCAADVNRDGRKDIVAGSISGPFFANSLAWFETPARSGGPFVRHVVTNGGADGRPHYLEFADVDGDSRGDILLGDSGAGVFSWWQHGATVDASWTKHVIAREKGATNIRAADIEGDGKVDVIGACGHGKGVFWFAAGSWQKHTIDAELATPHALAVGDFDGDGDVDVAVASYTAFVVRWYENDGHGGFTPHDIDTGHQQQAYDMKVADVDGDGRPDLILAGRESRNVVWYRNRAD